MKPGSTILNPNPSGYRNNGIVRHPQGRRKSQSAKSAGKIMA
jgi:hypothetical protein